MQSRDIRRMVMNRRSFLLNLAALCAVVTVPVAGWLRQVADTSVIRALRGKPYPGPLQPLKEEEIKRPGKWAG